MLVVANSVYNVNFAEVDKSLTRKFGTFKAMPYLMLCCAGAEPVPAVHTITFYQIGKAAMALLRITGACAAEQTTDSSCVFIGDSHMRPSFGKLSGKSIGDFEGDVKEWRENV